MTTNSILDYLKSNAKNPSITDLATKKSSTFDNSGFAGIFEASFKNSTTPKNSSYSVSTSFNLSARRDLTSVKSDFSNETVSKSHDDNQYVKNNDFEKVEPKNDSTSSDSKELKRTDVDKETQKPIHTKKSGNTNGVQSSKKQPTLDDTAEIDSVEDSQINLEDSQVENENDTSNEMLNQIASMMGISMQQLQKLLEAFGNNSEGTSETTNTNPIIDAIGKLEPETQKTISEAMKLIEKLMSSSANDVSESAELPQELIKTISDNQTVKDNQNKLPDGVKIDSLIFENTKLPQQLEEASTLLSQAGISFKKMLVDQLETVHSESKTIESTVSLNGVPLNNETDSTIKTNNITTEKTQKLTLPDSNLEVKSDISQQNNQNNGENPKEELTQKSENADIINGMAKASDIEASNKANQTVQKTSESKVESIVAKPTEVIHENIQQAQPISRTEVQATPEKLAKPVNVKPQEVINQVIEKAKISITPEKSEMVLELKPESLGKISLKVATERGIVVASFVAENQQVKDIIEANMQLLKESLQKQGLAVQSFSVSVGNGESQGFGRNNWTNENNQGKSKDRLNMRAVRAFETVGIQESFGMTSRSGIFNESKINLMA